MRGSKKLLLNLTDMKVTNFSLCIIGEVFMENDVFPTKPSLKTLP